MCPKRNKLFCFICLVMGGNQSAWTQEGSCYSDPVQENMQRSLSAFGVDCLSDRQIFRWHNAFAEGREDVNDDINLQFRRQCETCA
ncbi:hypothetical protein NQ318_005493 [Aromia moschata]|uniref:Uncharacterized protein n=1 Tax=Aromia moschata TaxID=1265417 RepID=A0AAV8XQ93_9CUCU|nr:hypothetical protein NQ318_005493 [Aromia moschata]